MIGELRRSTGADGTHQAALHPVALDHDVAHVETMAARPGEHRQMDRQVGVGAAHGQAFADSHGLQGPRHQEMATAVEAQADQV